VLLASFTEQRFTLDAIRAGPYSHDSYQGIFAIRVWVGLISDASSMSDSSSAVVLLHIDLGYPNLLSRSSLDGPLRPYRTEIFTCSRIKTLLLCPSAGLVFS
jgi:hypothetical protein